MTIGLPSAAVATAGEAVDFDALYASRAQQVARWARRLGGPGIDVEDVVQEVFVVAHRRLATLHDPAHLTSWLFKLTENKVRHQRRAARLWTLVRGTDAAATARSDQPSASESIEQRQAQVRLYQCLDKLKDRYRVPLLLFELEGLPGDRIAELLGLSLSTVWTRLHRGRAQLLARLQKLEALDESGGLRRRE